MMTNEKFRKYLSKINNTKSESDDDMYEKCKNKLEALKIKYPHGVSVEKPIVPLSDYICFEYAFGLYNFRQYNELKKKLSYEGFRNLYCDKYFVEWLINHQKLEDGDTLIIYWSFAHKSALHAGLIENGMITSKWGGGCIFKHKELEVPSTYEDRPKRYKIPNSSESFDLFKQYLIHMCSAIDDYIKTPD